MKTVILNQKLKFSFLVTLLILSALLFVNVAFAQKSQKFGEKPPFEISYLYQNDSLTIYFPVDQNLTVLTRPHSGDNLYFETFDEKTTHFITVSESQDIFLMVGEEVTAINVLMFDNEDRILLLMNGLLDVEFLNGVELETLSVADDTFKKSDYLWSFDKKEWKDAIK